MEILIIGVVALGAYLYAKNRPGAMRVPVDTSNTPQPSSPYGGTNNPLPSQAHGGGPMSTDAMGARLNAAVLQEKGNQGGTSGNGMDNNQSINTFYSCHWEGDMLHAGDYPASMCDDNFILKVCGQEDFNRWKQSPENPNRDSPPTGTRNPPAGDGVGAAPRPASSGVTFNSQYQGSLAHMMSLMTKNQNS